MKTSTAPPNPNRWLKLVELIQFMWENEFIPTELGWTMLVIIQKSNVDTQRIRLLEVVWKLVEAVLEKNSGTF